MVAADGVMVAAPAQLRCHPSVPRAALLFQNISGRLQLNISLELLPPGLLQSLLVPQASRQPSAIPSALLPSITVLVTVLYPGAGRLPP